MNKELRAIVSNVLESNLAIMSAFISLASALTEEQQAAVLEPLAKAKQANSTMERKRLSLSRVSFPNFHKTHQGVP